MDPAKLQRASDELSQSLRDAKLLLVAVRDRDLRERLLQLLTKAEANMAVIEAALAAKAASQVLNATEFDELLDSLNKQSFSKGKSEYLVNYAKLNESKGRRLSSKQVGKLLASIDFDNDRIAAAVALYPMTHDQQNFLQALDAFDFDSNRKKVEQKLGL